MKLLRWLLFVVLIVMLEDMDLNKRRPRWLWRWALCQVDKYLEI